MPRPGPTDIVPAMLTPGEAVLVPEVAEAVGRHNIEMANKHAVAKRKGIIPMMGYCRGASSVQGYAIGTPDVQQNNSAVQTSVKEPIQNTKPNMLNSATGVTTVGGGNNGQSTANQFTKIAPPMVGMPGVGTGPADNNLAKQNLFARTTMDTAARLGKSGNMGAATGIMQDLNKAKPISNTENRVSALESNFRRPDASITQDMGINTGASKFTALADDNGIQGYSVGTDGAETLAEEKVKNMKQGYASTKQTYPSDKALKEANQGPLTEPIVEQTPVPKPPRQRGGVTAGVSNMNPADISAEDLAAQRYNPVEGKAGGLGGLPQAEKAIQQGLYEKTLGVPQTGPYSIVPPRPTIEVGKNLAPVTRKGIVPVGEVSSEPTKYQFRPGRGGYAPEVQAPGTNLVPAGPRVTAEEANKVYEKFMAEEAAPGPKSAAAKAAEELGRQKPSGAWRPMSAAEAAKQSAKAAAEKAAAPGWEQGMRQAAMPNLRGIIPVAKKALGTVGSVLGAAHQFAQPSAVEVYAQKQAEMGNPQAQKVVAEGGVNPILQKTKSTVGSAAEAVEKPIEEAVVNAARKIMPGNAESEAVEQPLPVGASLKNGAKVGAEFPEIDFSKPSVQAKVGPEVAAAPDRVDNFTPREIGGQYQVDLDKEGSYVKSANKAGMERVAQGLRERGGIVKAASRPAGGVSDFWVNQGYPGGAAQYKAEQQQKALENLALNGGGTGNMSVSEFRRANARQKAAQGILADRERANVQREHLASENQKSEASMAATAAERAYQHSKDVKEAEQKQAEYEQRERIAGDRPVKIGEDIMPTRDVPAYQARKAHEAKVEAAKAYVKDKASMLPGYPSPDEALQQWLAESGTPEGDKVAALQAYLNKAQTPEEKAKFKQGIDQLVKPYAGALHG